MIEKKGFRAILDKEKLSMEKKAILVEAHPDDAALAEGLDIKLSRQGVCIVIVTFTDGGARFGQNDAKELIAKRKEESINSARISGAGMVVNLGYPDGELSHVEKEASESFSQIVAEINPDFIIAPNEFDEHNDHASAFRITKKVVNGSLPLYGMDTITMRTNVGEPINPTKYFSLSEEEKHIRDRAYLAHKSQVTDLPPDELKDVQNVVNLPEKRGKEIGVPYAAVLVKEDENTKDPIAEILDGVTLQP